MDETIFKHQQIKEVGFDIIGYDIPAKAFKADIITPSHLMICKKITV